MKTEGQPSAEPRKEKERLDRLFRFFTNLRHIAWDFGAIACLALVSMTLLAILLPQLTGGILSWWAKTLKLWLGWGSLWVAVVIGAVGIWMLRQRVSEDAHPIKWGRVLLLEVAAFTSVALLSVLGGDALERADAGMDGGRVGWALAEILRQSLSPVGLSAPIWRGIIFALLFLFCFLASLGIIKPIISWINRTARGGSEAGSEYVGLGPVLSEAPLPGSEDSGLEVGSQTKKRTIVPQQFRKHFRVEPEAGSAASVPIRDERLPPLDLLVNEQFNKPDERNINLTAGLIEKTLAEFGIPARVIGFRMGPTVTQFAIEPGYVEKEKSGTDGDVNRQKVRVSQISGLARDLALALAAERLRIEAPVPGRPYVGIEVPNLRSTIVRLRPILETEHFYKVGSQLAIALGRDVSGAPVVADLASMPHFLIAGTTGSGKSVCIAALTACLVMNNTPEELRIVMIDPKMVELVRFNGLPHLYGKVETNLERILTVLRWTVAEMDRRYKVLEASRSRNIDTHNRKVRRRKGEKPLPRIVIMIDELADLMMSAPEVTEHNIIRLAQMARATGIHLVIATQRPSTDVVTGLIKANFPARASFAVASSVDSRVILDTTGAESLLGRGDMLYLPPEAAGPIRVQGVMINDPEVERVITFWQKVAGPDEDTEISPWEEMIEQEQILADRDNLVEKAIEIVRQTQRASASMLQRRLRIGYPRAARLVDELEELGIIGPAVSGGREREVLVDRDEEEID